MQALLFVWWWGVCDAFNTEADEVFKMKCRGQLFGWELSSVNEESATTEISRKTARD